MPGLLYRFLASVFIGLLGISCFYPSINGTFVFDDTAAIINNKDVQLETPLTEIFKNDFWGTRLTNNVSHKSYRPLTVLSFRLNVFLSNGVLDPYGFHVVNLILHGIVCSLSLPLFLTVFKGKFAFHSALTASLLFAVHPVHSEPVSGVVGRADLLCAVFCVISYLIYAQATECKQKIIMFCGVVLSSFFTACAMFSKEQGITILGVCSAYDLFVARGFPPKKLTNKVLEFIISCKKKTVSFSEKSQLFLIRQIVLLVSCSGMVYFRYYLMGFQTPVFHYVDNPASFINGFFTKVINYNYIYALNCWILLCPVWLCFDWSMGCVPLIDLSPSNIDLRIFVVLVFWFLFGAIIIRSLTANFPSSSILLMGLSFFLIPFSVASNILFQVGFVIAERVLYLSSMGFSIVISHGLQLLYVQSKYKPVVLLSFVLFMFVNMLRCYDRSLDWLSEKRLFESGITVCPLNAKVHYNIAKTALHPKESIIHYRRALELNPVYEEAMNNLANILRDLGNTTEAEMLLKKAVSIRTNFPAAWMNLGIVLSNMGKYNEALEAYLTALTYRKVYPDCHYNLGNLFLSQKKYDEAYQAWRKATVQRHTHSVAWNNMIVMLDSMGEFSRAEMVGREALKYLPEDSALHFNLGNALGKLKKFEAAEIHFKKAIDLKAGQALYHTNLGVLYHMWKKYSLAEKHYTTALQINPNLTNAYQNLKAIKKFL